MNPPILESWSVKKLHNYLLARRFAIPKLQRNFVWDANRSAKLLDSIYRDMPIGSLFLWEMDRKSANLIRQSTQVLPSFNVAEKWIWFVIDGQQRLSVIHQAFEAQTKSNDSGSEIDFGRLCFVAKPPANADQPQRIVYRKPADKNFISLHDILAPNWKQRIPSRSKTLLKKVQDCRQRILNYPIPVIIVRSANLAEIGEAFIRVNSQGMRITSADRAIALMGKLDVRAMAQELRQKVRDEIFFLGSIDPILMGFNLVANEPEVEGDPPKLDAMAKRWSKRIEQNGNEKDNFRTTWHQYQKAFLSAVDYLRHKFPVYDESYLPSANMIATLAVFFFHHAGQPNSYQAKEIRKWFWTTGVAQRYSGRGYHHNIVADAQLFASLARGAKRHFVFHDRLDPVLTIQAAEYASHSARTRAFFCLLAARRPRYLENGETIPLGSVISHANKKNRHHIFPQAQLKNHFSAHIYNSLCNICFLVFRDNIRVGMRLPRAYLGDFRNAGKQQFRRVMKSHLVPVADDDGVWKRGLVGAFRQFRRERLKLICQEFEKEAGIQLFSRRP